MAGPNDPIETWTVAINADTSALQAELRAAASLGRQFTHALGNAFEGVAIKGKGLSDVLRTLALRLSGLLRGQAGSELAMRAPLAAGATFVLLSGAIAQVSITLNEIRLPLNWRYGPASRDIGDASYDTAQHMFAACGLRPLAPVHARGSRAGDDIFITWVRRTRVGGDNWDAAEVPLGEDSERYEVDILDGATVKRTLSATSPSATYTADDQVADFGSV
jgi:hypothetical protein